MLPLLRLVATLAWLAAAAGPGDLAALKDGQAVGAYRAQAVYLDPAGKPKGARFLHERGAAVDVLFFDSVPQVSLYFRTPPEDERGAPHALEHLLLGKGAAGRRLNTLMQMRMGDYTAGTYSDLTNYQFSSAAGPAEFYELLDAFLGALVRPDFTDEEARREAAHTAVAGSSGTLALEEKGTVYAEMVARMERPDAVRWDELGRLLYGPKHPLALNQGGEPSELWRLSPGDIRAFHERYYHLDGNMALIAALPMGWTAADFLARLDETLRRLEPAGSPRTYPALPPFEPRAERPIRFGRFPSDDAPAPQDVAMAWPPVRTFTLEEELRLGLALDLLGGGEPSYLHRDLVDRKTRLFDSGATGVGMGAAALPASYAHLWLSGLPLTSLTPEILGRLRAAVVDRARWLRELKAGSPELAETAEKTRARALARR
ncbi:MAG: insulinase family protein, partial [Elusimicrobia bacterium]|nr:insulinase family protein [Elusimicrobiota bacterium]